MRIKDLKSDQIRRYGGTQSSPARYIGEVVHITMGRGKTAIVDAADYELVRPFYWYPWKHPRLNDVWYAYAAVKIDGKKGLIAMHRLLAGFPSGKVVDHWDGDGLNNRRRNLRPCTDPENRRNHQSRRGKTSTFYGVSVCHVNPNYRWRASVQVHGEKVFDEYFTNEIDAARARDKAALLYHGEFAKLNFPDEVAR